MAVKIVDVRDLRQFSENPSDPSHPSLGEAADLTNAGIKARAIARKRGGYGQALGDFVLPEGTTVADLVRGAAEAALRDKGYRIVRAGSPEYDSALPLNLDIVQFWSWANPGFVEFSVSVVSEVTMSGNAIVGPMPVKAEDRHRQGTAAAFESVWIDVIQRGLANLSARMRDLIRPAQ